MPRRVIARGPSCIECRRRKIRCDRLSPCSYCVKIDEPCRYSSPPAIRPLPQLANFGVWNRLTRLEEEQASQKSAIAKIQGLLVSRRTPSPALPQAPAPPADTVHFLFSASTGNGSLLSPSDRPLIASAWRVFQEKVYPAIKILNLDTTSEVITQAMRAPQELNGPDTCLVVSICYASVAALSPSECFVEFRQPRDALITRFRSAVQSVMVDNDFTNTWALSILQSLLLYLICSRRDSIPIRPLLGVAIGIAMRMGLHRDGFIGTFTPLAIELRRRIWWEICTLDALTAIAGAGDPTIIDKISFASMPLNLDDSDLAALTQEPSHGRASRTGMSFSLVRFRLFHLAKAVLFSEQYNDLNGKTLDANTLRELVDDFWVALEKDYLSQLDADDDFDAVVLVMAGAFMVKLTRKIDPSRDCSEESEDILRDGTMLRDKRWACLFDTTAEKDIMAASVG